MFIKKLEIYGFKSFPYKVSIPFSSGITAIIGPNGAGKSNILDAIRWVLGEQSFKKLRIKELSDIIYSGNNDKKIDFAEVKLILNHEPPIWDKYKDFSEIVIVRRFYKNGESEFFINQNPCRLKDIQFLFLDLGINPQGYGIIEQGEVGKFIELSPKDRMVFLEDLAGVSRIKITEEEIKKNLQKTEENLLRLEDILFEIKNQYEHLKVQSEEAKLYLELTEKLKKLLFQKNIYLLKITLKEKEEIEALIKQFIKKKEDFEKELKIQEEQEQIHLQKLLVLEREINDLKEILNSEEKIYKELKDKFENLLKQEKDLNYKIEKERLKRENQTEKLEKLLQEANFLELQKQELIKKKEKIKEDLEILKKENERINKIFEEKYQKYQDFEKKHLILIKDKEILEDKLNFCKKDNLFIKNQKEKAENLLKDTEESLKKLKNDKEILKSLIEEKQKLIENLIKQKEEKKVLKRIYREFQEIPSFLKEKFPSLKSFLSLDKKKFLILETIWRENLNALVVKDLKILEDLFKKMSEEKITDNIILFLGDDKFIKKLSYIEIFEEFSEKMFENYLENPRFIYFKKNNLLFTPYGFIKKIFIGDEELDKSLYKINKELKTLESEQKKLRFQEEKINTALIKLEEQKRTLKDKINELEIKVKELEKNEEEIINQLKYINLQISKKEKDYENLKKEKENLEIEIQKYKREIEFLEQELIRINTKEEDIKVRKEVILKEIKNIKNQLKTLGFQEKLQLDEINYLKDKIKKANEIINEKRLKLSHYYNKLDQLNNEKMEQEKILKVLENKNKKIEKELRDLEREYHNLELKLVEKNMFLESIKKKLEEFDNGNEEELFEKDFFQLDLNQIKKEIEELKEKLKKFQHVNLASIKEFEIISERYNKLIQQKEDLENGIREFKKILQELRFISKERILKTLEKANQKLEEIFPIIFKNGKAKLYLTGEDPLNSGLDLKISFAEKNIKHLNMLSGGEKALCIIALLISFYLIKPGPFCILDEVDAFLDEKNSMEFIKLLSLIKKHSQIILITHNPYVMKEVDTLIGVTMEEKGISRTFILKKNDFVIQNESS